MSRPSENRECVSDEGGVWFRHPLVSLSCPARLGRSILPTTRTVRGFPEHARSSSSDTVSTNLKHERNSTGLSRTRVATHSSARVLFRSASVRARVRRGLTGLGAHLRADAQRPTKTRRLVRGTASIDGIQAHSDECWQQSETKSRDVGTIISRARERVYAGFSLARCRTLIDRFPDHRIETVETRDAFGPTRAPSSGKGMEDSTSGVLRVVRDGSTRLSSARSRVCWEATGRALSRVRWNYGSSKSGNGRDSSLENETRIATVRWGYRSATHGPEGTCAPQRLDACFETKRKLLISLSLSTPFSQTGSASTRDPLLPFDRSRWFECQPTCDLRSKEGLGAHAASKRQARSFPAPNPASSRPRPKKSPATANVRAGPFRRIVATARWTGAEDDTTEFWVFRVPSPCPQVTVSRFAFRFWLVRYVSSTSDSVTIDPSNNSHVSCVIYRTLSIVHSSLVHSVYTHSQNTERRIHNRYCSWSLPSPPRGHSASARFVRSTRISRYISRVSRYLGDLGTIEKSSNVHEPLWLLQHTLHPSKAKILVYDALSKSDGPL